MASLTRIVDLTISSAWQLPADGYGVLERLGSLRRLCLSGCAHLPASLSSLSQITALNVEHTPYKGTATQMVQQIEAGLAGLAQLRHLALSPCRTTMPFPAALTAMAHLHTLAWMPKPARPPEPWSPFPALPPGGYLPSLRRLVVPAALAAPSLGVLSAGASHLEALALFAFADAPIGGQQALMEWAGAHPALRQLTVEMQGRHLCAATLLAVTGALQRRPALQLKLEPVQPLAWEACEAVPAGLEEPWQLPDSW